MSIKKYWPEVIPMFMLLFIPLSYFRHLLNINFYFTLAYISIFFFLIVATIAKNKKVLNVITNLRGLYFFLVIQTFVLLFVSYFSKNISFSSSRSIFSMFELFSVFTIFYFIQYFYIQNIRWRHFFEISSIFVLGFILLGQIFIPEWKWGGGVGLRLSGGLNPNS